MCDLPSKLIQDKGFHHWEDLQWISQRVPQNLSA
jgi:hypothetical protein